MGPMNGAIMAETISFSCSFYGAHLLCDTGSLYIIGERKLEIKLPEKNWFQEGERQPGLW